jgi:NADPH:quinone reductase-like Zn-dependent oxidoreductase
VGIWDPFEREGGFRDMGQQEVFPYILGSDGAGTVERVGASVTRFSPGDTVYAVSFLNPKGGTYAEYFVAQEQFTAAVPQGLSLTQAGVLGVDGLTALTALRKVLEVRAGDRLVIFGASGGVGHFALQLAKRLGAQVLAVASGEDGEQFCREIGADLAVNGRDEDSTQAAISDHAGKGFDALLLTAGGPAAEALVAHMVDGGRVAWPHGVEGAPKLPEELTGGGYDMEPSPTMMEELNRLIESDAFRVEVAERFSLDQAVNAHRKLGAHFLGKLALTP